jgi:hypothetical protein
MKANKAVLFSTALALVALLVPFVFACEPGYSPGFWKHNVRVYVEGQGSYSEGMSAALLESYESIIAGAHPGFTLEGANTIFWDKEYRHTWLDVANWFNTAAGLDPYIGD